MANLQESSKITSREHEDLVLHRIPEPGIEYDISWFLKHRLSAIGTDRSLAGDWPGRHNYSKSGGNVRSVAHLRRYYMPYI